jgi:hypothetical protein
MHEMDVIAANQHRLHLGDEALPLIGAKPRHGRFSAREALEDDPVDLSGRAWRHDRFFNESRLSRDRLAD